MDEERKTQLEIVKNCLLRSQMICDPLDYQLRQRDLILCVAKFIVKELDDYHEQIRSNHVQLKLDS